LSKAFAATRCSGLGAVGHKFGSEGSDK
jgi:hypothetical protein